MVPLRFVLALSNVAAVQRPLNYGKNVEDLEILRSIDVADDRADFVLRQRLRQNGAVAWDPELSHLALLTCGRGSDSDKAYERPPAE